MVIVMGEKRFKIYQDSIRKFESDRIWGVKSETNSLEPYMTFKEAEKCCELLNEQQDKITELEKNFEDLVNWSTEISKRNVLLDEKIGRLQQEEKLYAQEILRLNELLKQYQANQDLGGGY